LVSFFWKRGFYFNGSLFFYKSHTWYTFLGKLNYGLASKFIKIILAGCELFNINSDSTLTLLKDIRISEQPLKVRYLLNSLIISTFPVFINFKTVFVLKLVRFYVINTYKGISLFFNKPLKKRSRSKTYISSKRRLMSMQPLLKVWWSLN